MTNQALGEEVIPMSDDEVEDSDNHFLEKSLRSRAESFGLSAIFVDELPRFAKQLMNRLGKLGNAVTGDKKISMLDETLMSAALVANNSELIKKIFDCDDELELKGIQNDLIMGSILSDLGKVANEQLIWMYNGLNFNSQIVKDKLPSFLEKYSGINKNCGLLQLPYSVAMDFYREINYNGTEKGSNSWDNSRRECDKLLQRLGFKVNSEKGNEYGADQCTFHDVMTGAHLAVLPDILKKCGIEKDARWQRAIFVAKNHHLSRGFVNGLPPLKDQKFLETIWIDAKVDQNLWTHMALLEEIFDMSFASVFRTPRHGDSHGINAIARIINNLIKSEKERRMSRVERAYISLLIVGMGDGDVFSDLVVKYADNIKNDRQLHT